MISADLKFEGFDVRSWTHLISLFSPAVVERMETAPASTDDPSADGDEHRDGPRGTLVVIVNDTGNVLKSFHTTRGRVTDLTYTGPDELPELCERYAARRSVVLRQGVIEEIGERLAMRLQRGDDYVTQWLALARILREMQEAGLIRIWPRPLANVPIPSAGTVRRALDVVVPDDHAAVITLWERGRPWTAAALRRRGGEIDLVAGPDLILRWTGPLGGDWRRDHRVIVGAVERAVAPVHLGIFAEAVTMRRLLKEANAGSWAVAVAIRDVIVHPTPPYVAVALGADAVRGLAQQTTRLLGGLDAFSAIAPLTALVRGRISEVASVSSTLGFNPLRALGAMLRRDHSSTDDPLDDGLPTDAAAL